MTTTIRIDHRGRPHEPEEPGWEAGECVRLVRPDNPDHPARGREGVVVRARWFPPVLRCLGFGAPSEPICPSVWLLWVRFGTGDDLHPYGLFGREVDRVEGA